MVHTPPFGPPGFPLRCLPGAGLPAVPLQPVGLPPIDEGGAQGTGNHIEGAASRFSEDIVPDLHLDRVLGFGGMRAAARPLPSAIPPAARTGTGVTASTTCGTSTNVEILPPNPPASANAMEMTGAPISTVMSKDSEWPCSQGWVKFTTKDCPVSSRIRRMLPRRCSAVRRAPPRLPSAPALETAAASAASLPKGPIPACMMG